MMWVFGYGSLTWKAGFPYERKVPGYISGYVRRFYQHSIDHRGVPDKPGRVVTLLPADAGAPVWGVAYCVQEQLAPQVLQQLDFREKNGYTKCEVIFHPAPSADNQDLTEFPLTIYVATTDNPSFAGEASIEQIAAQVWSAVGPSGPNKEYVYQLAHIMRSIALHAPDEHLYALEAALHSMDQAQSSGQNRAETID